MKRGAINARIFQSLFIALIISCTLLTGISVVDARVRIYTLVKKTRAATLILIGQVSDLRADSIVVKIKKVLKGIPSGPQIEVLWERQLTHERRPSTYQLQEEILLFANPKGNQYEPVAGSQGTLKLQPGWADQYQAAVQHILGFDASLTSEAKMTILIDMLEMENRLAQLSALEIIYREFHANAFPTDPLIRPVLKLVRNPVTKVAVNSIQVLSRIGDKSVVPELILLLSSLDSHVAETAFRVLKGMTGAEIEFESRQPAEVKAKAIQKWKDWWGQNKDKVKLLR